MKIKLNPLGEKEKFYLGHRDWMEKNDHGLLIKGRTYEVDESDPLIQQYLKDKTFVKVGKSKNKETDVEKLQKISYIDKTKANKILKEYNSYNNFMKQADIEYLASLEGIGHKRAETIMKNINLSNKK